MTRREIIAFIGILWLPLFGYRKIDATPYPYRNLCSSMLDLLRGDGRMSGKRGVGRSLVLMPMPIISQGELAHLQLLRNQLQALRREMEAAGASVFARLERAAEVEPGVHRAWIDEHHHGTKVLRVLMLNGSELEGD